LKPAPAGDHKTRDGVLLSVGEDSIISKIEEIKEVEESPIVDEASTDIKVNEETMAKAKLTDGTEIMTDEEGDFQVGQKLYAITKEGEKVTAPYGEHTTDSGIVLTVDGEGFITGVKYPDMSGEGSLEDYKKEMKKMKEAMSEMMSVMTKFSKDFESYKNDYEDFKNSPVFEKPIVTEADVDALIGGKEASSKLTYVYDTIKLLRKQLDERGDEIALIGFTGAPWTLATYMIEGQGTKTYNICKKMMYSNPALLHKILAKVTEVVKLYMEKQIQSGIDVVQIFDSWAAAIEPSKYNEFSWKYMVEIADYLKSK
jgi:hypothetical protein